MDSVTFLVLLSFFALISSLVTEVVKKLITDKDERAYNIIVIVIALIVGGVGMLVYYQLNGISFSINNIIYAILMGLASGLASMVGYDKVKQAISQLIGGSDE